MNEMTNDETRFNGHTRYVHRPLPAAPHRECYSSNFPFIYPREPFPNVSNSEPYEGALQDTQPKGGRYGE